MGGKRKSKHFRTGETAGSESIHMVLVDSALRCNQNRTGGNQSRHFSQYDISLHAVRFAHSFTTNIHSPAHKHINNLCQLCLEQASSTSLAVINCGPCFPMILSVVTERLTPVRLSGSGPWQRFSPEPRPLPPSLTARPSDLSTLPPVGSGWTGRTWVRRPRW